MNQLVAVSAQYGEVGCNVVFDFHAFFKFANWLENPFPISSA